jgi:hypothetical protein
MGEGMHSASLTPMGSRNKVKASIVSSGATTAAAVAAGTAATNTTSRLYRAPQPTTIRRIDSTTGVASDKVGNARRRRQQQQHLHKTPSSASFASASNRRGGVYEPHGGDDDDDSSNSILDGREVPSIWMMDGTKNLHRHHSGRRKRRNGGGGNSHRADAATVVSESGGGCLIADEEASVYTHHSMIEGVYNNLLLVDSGGGDADSGRHRHHHHHHHPQPPQQRINGLSRRCYATLMRGSGPSTHTRRKQRNHRIPWFVIQAAVFVVFCYVVLDSRRKVHIHKLQLQQYDEERAHILEQMTWIDAAAKKVHQKYNSFDPLLDWSDNNNSNDAGGGAALQDENHRLREELERLQRRVQKNARARTIQQFGDRPVQISIPIDADSDQHLVIGLSDDAPHAVSVLLQQVAHQQLDRVNLQQLDRGSVVQVAAAEDPTIVLEFVERSRGCRGRGSVALHQLETSLAEFLPVLVLKIHLQDHVSMQDDDVCIGYVITGLEALESMLPQIPMIHSEAEEAQLLNQQDGTNGAIPDVDVDGTRE